MPMPTSSYEQKRIESWYLAAARNVGVPIPAGELACEEPDFRFHTTSGALGIELTEILRPASSNHGISPVEEESFHREIIESSPKGLLRYTECQSGSCECVLHERKGQNAKQARTGPHTVDIRSSECPSCESDCAFRVQGHSEWFRLGRYCGPVKSQRLVERRSWRCYRSRYSQSSGSRIAAKNSLVDTYRSNLPDGAELWLLLYSGVTVARSMPIPDDIEAWHVPSQFDRVFWFTSLECQFAEIQKK